MITILRWLRLLMTWPGRRALAKRKKKFEKWLVLMKPGLIRLYGQEVAEKWIARRLREGELLGYEEMAYSLSVRESAAMFYFDAYAGMTVEWPDVFEGRVTNVQQDTPGSGDVTAQDSAERSIKSQGDDRRER